MESRETEGTVGKLDDALHTAHRVDALAAGNSFLHRVHPAFKLLLTLWFLALTASFPPSALSGLLGLSLYWIVGFSAAGLSLREALVRARWVLALLLLVGAANPFLDRTPILSLGSLAVSGGVLSLTVLLVKGLFAVLASWLLVTTTTMEELCWAMRLLHVPAVLVTVVMLTYRYLILLLQEARRMSMACALRCPGQRGVPFPIWGAFAGQLLLRAVDRGSRVYDSMTLRGFRGEYPPPVRTAARGGLLWFLGWSAALLFLRLVPVFELAGRLL